MKTVLLWLSVVSLHSIHAMEEDSGKRTNPLATWREQHGAHEEVFELQAPKQVYASGRLFGKGEFVTIDLEGTRGTSNKLSSDQWQQELEASIKNTKTVHLLHLLSQEGQPAVERGFHFTPYQDALEQIITHKDREERILTNTAQPDAKCCKCCNSTYVWNRFLAPGLIVGVKVAQLAFAGWGIARAVNVSLTQTPGNYVEAAASAAPAIGSLVSAFGDLPFSLINAWRRRILKTQQAKYEYYLLAQHSVTMQDKIERLLQDNQKDLKELLARTQPHEAQHTRELPHNNNDVPDLEKEFGDGIILQELK